VCFLSVFGVNLFGELPCCVRWAGKGVTIKSSREGQAVYYREHPRGARGLLSRAPIAYS
jgi:hypothetical protein